MTEKGRRVLVIAPDEEWERELLRLVMPPLSRVDCQITPGSKGFSVTDEVERSHFDLIVVGFPMAQPPMGDLLRSIRWKESACHESPVLLVTTDEHDLEAREYLNRGVNRTVLTDATEWEMDDALGELLAVEARVAASLLVKLELPLRDKVERVMAQLDNLSASGMLIRGHDEVQMGAPMPFEFALPGQPLPVRGLAKVVRPTTREREGLVGFAARFVRFDGDGEDRLKLFIERQAGTPGAV
jgi:DNA-binding NarL/FixJ family response regulator